jgi:pimeloyl-ACP methyl ester carboxylesterase
MKTIPLILSLLLAVQSSLASAKDMPSGFKAEKVTVNGVTLNVYKGGRGDALLLVHGFAQSALMWAPVMTALKEKFTIVAPDLRGAGLSDAPADGYDKLTMAADLRALLDHYGIAKARVVGHDVGLMVAYAMAAQYPETVVKLAVMDAFVPGVGPGDSIYNSSDIWHFRFHGPYAEKLVAGREYTYLDALWTGFSARPSSFPEADKKYYAAQYARAGRMRAGFAWFSTFPKDAIDNKRLSATQLKIPVLAMGGEKSLGQALIDTMKVVSPTAEGQVVKACGHWMLEECPAETIEILRGFL